MDYDTYEKVVNPQDFEEYSPGKDNLCKFKGLFNDNFSNLSRGSSSPRFLDGRSTPTKRRVFI